MAIHPGSKTTTFQTPPEVSGAWPLVGHLTEFLRNPEELLSRGHREHGLVYSIRLGNRTGVVLVGAENSRFIFTETDKRLSIRAAYPFVMRMFDPDFYFFADRDEYYRQRSLVLPRFQGRQLGTYVDVMVAEVLRLESLLGDRGEFDLTGTLGPMVMQIAARAMFGEEFGTRLRDDDFRLFRHFSKGIEYGLFPPSVPTPRTMRAKRARGVLHEQLGEVIRRRRQETTEHVDFLQTLVEARYENDEPVPDQTLVNMLLLFTWAGHETTTGHLSWALIDLLQHPLALEDVLREQEAVLGGADLPSFEQTVQMKYLDNALHETERLRPVVPVQLREASVDIPYAGHLIPKGSLVFAAPLMSHVLPEIFPEPHQYRPDRFTKDPKAKQALIGFGGGVHRCLGVHFAYLEMKVVLSLLLRHYEFELVDPAPRPIRGAKTRWPASPCRVRYVRRTAVSQASTPGS